ncbi:MAG TPA: hypothetical protein VK508_09640 [Cyclobacteriaceae bacterium]|nr:hypothetical protein [Cyclobacteriaceae bacterium]
MINPYYIYIGSFLISTLVYLLNWSSIFPTLKPALLVFLIGTMILALPLGLLFQTKKLIRGQEIGYHWRTRAIFRFIIILWIVEFVEAKGIPLLVILIGGNYDYTQFGVPTLHVFVVTFTSFFSVYLFHVYLSTRTRRVLFYYIILMTLPLLIISRGMFMINVASSVIVYLQFSKKISVKRILILVTLMLIVLYGFGVVGNIRSSYSTDKQYSSNYILTNVSARPEFINGPIPNEYFWSYLYIASPIGNLQHNIDIENRLSVTARNSVLFINNEFIFDFISKRINRLLHADRVVCKRFVDFLTVASVYTNSYIYAGWVGLCLMALAILVFPIFYMGLIRRSNTFYVVATSTMSSMYLFMIFDNMFTFTGLSFQLVYPLVLGRFFR